MQPEFAGAYLHLIHMANFVFKNGAALCDIGRQSVMATHRN